MLVELLIPRNYRNFCHWCQKYQVVVYESWFRFFFSLDQRNWLIKVKRTTLSSFFRSQKARQTDLFFLCFSRCEDITYQNSMTVQQFLIVLNHSIFQTKRTFFDNCPKPKFPDAIRSSQWTDFTSSYFINNTSPVTNIHKISLLSRILVEIGKNAMLLNKRFSWIACKIFYF